MKKPLILALVSIAALTLVCTSFVLQDKKPSAPAAYKPDPAHVQLLKRVGNWTTATQMTMGPARSQMQTIGTAKITSLFEGRFLHEENTGTMNGAPYLGARLTGYNSGSKKYEASWVYSLSTGIMNAVGTSKDDGKTVEWTATYDNEAGVRETVQITTKTTDDDHFSVSIRGKGPDGSDTVMETAYTRAK